MTFTDAEKLTEIRREIALRARVYPNRIANGQMTLADAERHSSIMLAIALDYERRIEAAEPKLPFAASE